MSAQLQAPWRLHGYAVSNFFNIAHAALLETASDFDIVITRASQDEQFLVVSPMGKIPVLQTPHGWIAETVAILGYIEDCQPGPTLHAADAFARARERQLINIVQLYVEMPVRTLFPGVFMGGSNSPAVIEAARITLDRAIAAIRQLLTLHPFLLGEQLSYADLFAFYCLDIAERVCGFVYGRSVLAELGLQGWAQQIAERPSTQLVQGNFETALSAYLVEKNADYRIWPDSARSGGALAE
ncbi:glutathione S-transferase family protein [Pseudomonas baetica]|uniref:glutathione S-transferase family protein n=1 Tax=Pseudomonas baetica TaxID=674054 RepID=UPI002404DDA7|nr:glutathione S-transferase family protein [Pseudomonas baetica]MDF9773298.1 glutathione S-transferase [Pseudomonas baetica]